MEITEKQQIIYEFIKSEIRANGFPPSVREICKAVCINSTSTVHAQLEILEKKGYIKRSPSKNRSIEILEEDFYNAEREYINVPIVGKVSAGVPILAVENIEDHFPIPLEYVHDDDVFMLKIEGDSMIGAGILNRDLVLVRQQRTANNGDIVVALIDDSATVKTFYKEDDYFRLQPENTKYKPIFCTDISIVGKVIGLFRKF